MNPKTKQWHSRIEKNKNTEKTGRRTSKRTVTIVERTIGHPNIYAQLQKLNVKAARNMDTLQKCVEQNRSKPLTNTKAKAKNGRK